MTRGKFITMEGVDGAGKSSHVQFLAGRLEERGIRVCVTREPGGTPLAERLRELVLAESMDALGETLLLFAARSDHIWKVILPALEQGTWVLCDRFTDATFAYQGGGKGVARPLIEALAQAVHPGLRPDRTFLFDCSHAVARERLGAAGRALDRFESEAPAFFERVRHAYLQLADAEPDRIVLIDASRSLDAVRHALAEEALRL